MGKYSKDWRDPKPPVLRDPPKDATSKPNGIANGPNNTADGPKDPTDKETQARKAASLDLAARIEAEKREDIEKAIEAHSRLVTTLAVASDALAKASAASATLLDLLSKKRIYRESAMSRRLRLIDTVRTIGAAHRHIAKFHVGSVNVNKSVRESVDDMIRPDSDSIFE